MDERRFPIQWHPSLRSIPWALAETFRAQAERNHRQTLERLAERGGLDPSEAYLAAHGRDLRALPEAGVAERWLITASEVTDG